MRGREREKGKYWVRDGEGGREWKARKKVKEVKKVRI